MTQNSTARLLRVGLALALTVGATGCMSSEPSAGNDDAGVTAADGDAAAQRDSSCATAPTIEEGTPTIAILGATGPVLDAYRSDIDTVVATSKPVEARVIVNGVGVDAEVPNLLANVVMVGEGNNELFRSRDLECKTQAVAGAIDVLVDHEPPQQYDAFQALRKLAGNLEGNLSEQPVDVVLLTPLASVGGGVDLSDPAVVAKPAEAINTLARNQLMPPSCAGWRIHAVGADTGLDDAHAAALREFWRQYAQKCGGMVVSWTDHLATFPATTEIPPADTSQIAVDKEPERVTATLGADVLFGPDSSALLASAQGALNELLSLTRTYPGEILNTGHINVVGPNPDSASGDQLSLRRAKAVEAWLVARGVDPGRITTVGKGAREPVYPSPSTEQEKQANRRVVIVIKTSAQ